MANFGPIIINCLPPPLGTFFIATHYNNKFRNSIYHYAFMGSFISGLLSLIPLSFGLKYFYPYSVPYFFKHFPQSSTLFSEADPTRLSVTLLTLATLIITSAWVGRMIGFYYGSSKLLPGQPRNKWNLFKAACKFAWVEIFPKDGFKFFNAITTNQQNEALCLLDRENMLNTEERRQLYFSLIATKPGDADQRIPVILKLKQATPNLSDQEIITYFKNYTSFQHHPIKGLIELIKDRGLSLMGEHNAKLRLNYLDIITSDDDVSFLKRSGHTNIGESVLRKFKNHDHRQMIKNAFAGLLSEPPHRFNGIFSAVSDSNSIYPDYLNILEKTPQCAKNTVAVLTTLERQKNLSSTHSLAYWTALLKANWNYSEGLSAATAALALDHYLLPSDNPENFSTLCEYSKFSQEIADKIAQIRQKNGCCTQVDYDRIIDEIRQTNEPKNSPSHPLSNLIVSVTQDDSPLHGSILRDHKPTSVAEGIQVAPNL